MIKPVLIIFLNLVFFTTAFSQNDEKANVLAVERNAANALTKHDVVALNSIFSDDVNIISATGAVVNKQQLFQAVQNVNSATVSDMQVRIEGYIAIVTGIVLETGKDINGVYSNKLRFTDVLAKSKGVWKIIASQATAVQ
jgi:ketosteroid isomerase-like protein